MKDKSTSRKRRSVSPEPTVNEKDMGTYRQAERRNNHRKVKVSETTFVGECGQEIVVTKYAIFDYCNKCHKMHIFRVKGVYEYEQRK